MLTRQSLGSPSGRRIDRMRRRAGAAVPEGLDTPETPCVAAEDEAAVECALEALADTKPGSLHIEYIGNNHYWYRNVRHALQGDGTAYLIHSLAVDVSEVFDATGRFTRSAARASGRHSPLFPRRARSRICRTGGMSAGHQNPGADILAALEQITGKQAAS